MSSHEHDATVWTIPITEFVLPNGQQVERRWMHMDKSNRDEIENILKINDVRFEMEQLRTGDVSFTLTHREHGDLSSLLLFKSKTPNEKEEQFYTWFNGLKAANIQDMIERHQLEDAEDQDDTQEVLDTPEQMQAAGKAEHERLGEIAKEKLEAENAARVDTVQPDAEDKE